MVLKREDNQRIQNLLEALKIAHSGMDATTFWPCHAPQVEAYFLSLLSVNLLQKYEADKTKFSRGLGKIENVGILRHLLSSSVVIGLKIAKKYDRADIPNSEMVDFTLAILDAIKGKVLDDEFCLGNSNRILESREVEGIVGLNGWIEVEALVWSLYYDFNRQGGMMIHGSYGVRGKTLLVKDFFDLKPAVWRLDNRHLNLKMYFLYQPAVKIKIDFANHPVYEEAILDKLEKCWVGTEKGPCGIKEIGELDDYFSKICRQQTKLVEALSPLEKIKKGAEIYYYLLKPFFDFYGEDWRPPKEVYHNIDKSGLEYWNRYKPTRKEDWLTLCQLYDPRTDWVK